MYYELNAGKGYATKTFYFVCDKPRKKKEHENTKYGNSHKSTLPHLTDIENFS